MSHADFPEFVSAWNGEDKCDVDANVSLARALAAQLNDTLDFLERDGVVCGSVIGFFDRNYDSGGLRDIRRVSLCLDFRPKAKDGAVG